MCWRKGGCGGGGGTSVTWITSPSARLPVKIPFSHTVMVQCAELGDISGPFHRGGGEWRHAYASLLETIISARSIVHPTAWLAECTASRAGGGWRGGSCSKAGPSSWGEWLHAASDAPHSSLARRCSLRGGAVGGCCPQVDAAAAGTILMGAAEPASLSGTRFTWFYFPPSNPWLGRLTHTLALR